MSGAEQEWAEPDRSLVEQLEVPIPAFDWGMVPDSWGSWIAGASEDTGAPPDYIFANLIGTASAVIGNARRVRAWPGWEEPPHIWVANIGNPSSGKTPGLDPFKRVLASLEKEAANPLAMRRDDIGARTTAPRLAKSLAILTP